MTDALNQRLWDDHWHLLCHRSEVGEARDFVRFDIHGKEVVAFHDGASVVVFDNRCPHRGARIFDGSHGNRRFVCRYHGWSYSKGRLFVGNKEAFANCPIEQADLNRYRTDWVGDFLFVSKAPRRPLLEQLDGVAPILEAISTGLSGRRDFNSFIYECDWRIAVENALEPYHVGLIHPDTLHTLDLQPGRNDYFGTNSIWYSELGDARMDKRLKSLTRLFDLPYQFPGYMSLYMFPFTMISGTYGFSYSLQSFIPSAEAGKTHFTSRLYSSRTAAGVKPELLESFFESTAALNRSTFDEDHEICKRVPADSWSSDPPRFWSASEEKLLHFRRCFSEFAARSQS